MSLWTQKLLIGVGVDTFTGKNNNRRHKSAAQSAQSARTASFRPLAATSAQPVISELFHLKDEAQTCTVARADLRERSVLPKALSDELAASNIAELLMAAQRRPHM